MGLDNIPREYPCAAKATRDSDNRIDCVQTQEQGNCTWKNEKENNPMVAHLDRAAGMFGTDCWYRGKYGTHLIDMLYTKEDSTHIDHSYEREYSWYGENDDGLSPEYCFNMAKWMRDNTEKFAFNVKTQLEQNQLNYKKNDTSDTSLKEYINDWAYAIWWLEFVGKTSNGSAVWW